MITFGILSTDLYVRRIDTDENGRIDRIEFEQYLSRVKQTEDSKYLFEIADVHHDGSISLDEYDDNVAVAPEETKAPVPATTAVATEAPVVPPKSGMFRPVNYQVAWTKNALKGKTGIKMIRNERVVYYTKKTTIKDYGKCYVISTSENFDVGSPSLVGFVTSESKTRFTLWTTENGGEPVEALGMAFYNAADSLGPEYRDFGGKAFRIVIPKEKNYRATSKNTSLSMLAQLYEAPAESFITMLSKLPRRTAQGKLILKFGDVFVIKSIKNFMIEYEGKKVFMCYRSSRGTVTVPVMEPLTPLHAFAMTIGIITS